MPNKKLTVIFWNAWYHIQDGSRGDGTEVCARIHELIGQYSPDCFGLNEVAVNRTTGYSPIIELLRSQGYAVHFSPFSPVSDQWAVGSVFASRRQPKHVIEHRLGRDTQAERRGYADCTVKAIEAHLEVKGQPVIILVNYLSSLAPLDWRTHITHRKSYDLLLGRLRHDNLIIGGDFNETKYMISWLRTKKGLTRKTGSLFNPTWRWNGERKRIAFANYDHLLYASKGGLRLENFAVMNRWPSDHSPLLGVFSIK